ncbi:hypothetical protein HZA87_04785 [Candidatus Uhrbacteria bacterium]|nr:hypothetical protein [Candidatus Uhrbacteria bacterium]
MRRFIPNPEKQTSDALMARASYVRHCVDVGRSCYHRSLNDPPFPRFHALVSVRENGIEIDLHLDALDSITHRGNHDQPWAYEGGRVDEEMHRVVQAVSGKQTIGEINRPNHSNMKATAPEKVKRSLFEILFTFRSKL